MQKPHVETEYSRDELQSEFCTEKMGNAPVKEVAQQAASAVVGGGGGGEPEKAKPKCKACCACPETKKARDQCIVERGESDCLDLIEAHKACMRSQGFNI